MRSSTISKLTTGTLAVLLTGAIGFGIHQADQTASAQRTAAAWQQEAVGWQDAAATTQLANRKLVTQYNRLAVRATQAAAAGAQNAVAPVVAVQSAAPAPVAQPAPAQAPTSQAS